MKRTVVTFILCALLMLTAASCGNKKAAKTVTLRFSNAESGTDQIRMMRDIVAAFEKENPDIKIKLEWGTTQQAILTNIAGKNAPDVFLWWGGFHDLIQKNVLLDLAPYVKKHGIKTSDYWPALVSYYTYGGSLYALPLQLKTNCILYNKDMFTAEGIETPSDDWTWNDYYRIAKKLTADTDGNGVRDRFGTITPGFMGWIYLNGGKFVDPVTKKAVIDSPETRQALSFLLKLNREVSPSRAEFESMGKGTFGTVEAFINGRVSMIYAPAWMLQGMKYAKFNWDVLPLPIPPSGKRVQTFDDVGMVVSSTTRHPEAAFRFVSFYCGAKSQRISAKGRNGIPSNMEIAKKVFAASPPEHMDYYLQAAEEATIPVALKVSGWTEIVDTLYRNMDLLFNGQRNMDETLSVIDKEVNRILQ